MTELRKISITGLGYVGLPLALAFSKHTNVIGYDTNPELIDSLQKGIDKNRVTGSNKITTNNILFTNQHSDISDASFHIIAVPTPIDKAKQPDLEIILSATRRLAGEIKHGDIIVYESTVYPGLTEEECLPILESVSGLECGKDFYLGYSPERINPGNSQHSLENTVKVVSAQDEKTLNIIANTYSKIVTAGIHIVPGIKVAEAAKVIENTQRDINIALMNELSLIFEKLQIDTEDVLKAAGTKWNFLKFNPGLVGGHCIGVDPYYLTHKSLQLGYAPRVILSGRSVNDSMGLYVARMVVKQLIKSGVMVKNAKVVILGFAFKENISDIRNTRVIDIVHELESFDINVQVYDPLVDSRDVEQEYNFALSEKNQIGNADAVILAVIHDEFIKGGWPYIEGILKNKSGVVFDVKSVLPRENKADTIILHRL